MGGGGREKFPLFKRGGGGGEEKFTPVLKGGGAQKVATALLLPDRNQSILKVKGTHMQHSGYMGPHFSSLING